MHDSDCSVHNMPAFPNGPCDCGELTELEVQKATFWLEEIMKHMEPTPTSIKVDAHPIAQILIGIERGGK